MKSLNIVLVIGVCLFLLFEIILSIFDIKRRQKELAKTKKRIAVEELLQFLYDRGIYLTSDEYNMLMLGSLPANVIKEIAILRTQYLLHEELSNIWENSYMDCMYFAKSRHLKCAVNPKIECKNCSYFVKNPDYLKPLEPKVTLENIYNNTENTKTNNIFNLMISILK